MAVKILIKRILKEGTLKRASELLIRARSAAMEEPGYISSETLRGCDNPNEIVVISMWERKIDWENFREKPARREILDEFAEILESPPMYASYNLGLYS